MIDLLGNSPRPLRREDLDAVRHSMMRLYGWIPEKEFYEETSIDDVLHLLSHLVKDKMAEKEEYERIQSKMKRR